MNKISYFSSISTFLVLIDANSVKTGTIQPLYNLIELDWQSKSKKLKDIKNKDCEGFYEGHTR